MTEIREERPAMTISINEMILMQLRDLKEGQRELNKRMDRMDTRMDRIEMRIDKVDGRIDKLESKIDENRRELNARMDRIENKIDASTNHGQIATISTVGIGVAAVSSAIGVLYTLFFK